MARLPIRILAALLVSVLLLVAADAANPKGYLADGAFDILKVLPPAPEHGDARYEADRAIFRQTRKMIGSDRYKLATNDVDTTAAALMRDFSCAVGVSLTPDNAPRTRALVLRSAVDTTRATGVAKDHYRRLRPFQIDQGNICQPQSDLADSYDYPSGHTTYGWTWALILSDLLPERVTPILARGRAYGDSRFICGAHNESAVEAGFLSAGATMQAVRQTPAYQADAVAARAELRALVDNPATPKPSDCDVEAKLVAQRVL